jgi:hypothetical protein
MPGGTLKIVATVAGGIPHTAYNIWHVDVVDDTGAEVQAAIDAIRDFYTTSSATFPTVTNITIGTSVINISTTPPRILGPTPRVVAGTGGGTAQPAQLANVVSWRTAFAGRSFRGRTYLGPLGAGAITGNIMTAAVSTATQNAANALIAASNAAGAWNLQVYSVKLNTATPIISGVVNTKVETQRRRNK